LHRVIEWFPGDYDRSLESFEDNGNQMICRISQFHFGTSQGRVLTRYAQTGGLVAGDAICREKSFPNHLRVGRSFCPPFHPELRLKIEDLRFESATEGKQVCSSPENAKAD
jgi:hypothetical protein